MSRSGRNWSSVSSPARRRVTWRRNWAARSATNLASNPSYRYIGFHLLLGAAPQMPGPVGTAVGFGRNDDDRPRVLEIRTDRGAERPDDLADLGRSHLSVLHAHLDQDRVDHEAPGLVLLGYLEEALCLGLLVDQGAPGNGGIPLPARDQENDPAVDQTVRDNHLRHH